MYNLYFLGGTIIPCNSTFDFPSAPAQQSLSSCSNDSTKQKAVQRQSFSYVPLNVGVFKVEVIANGQHIGKSPYDVRFVFSCHYNLGGG